MPRRLDLYLLRTGSGRFVLFSPIDAIQRAEQQDGDHVQRFLHWFTQRPNRVLAFFGRVMRTGHQYYNRLEDRIDPVERVLKAMASTDHLIVHHSSTLDAQVRSRFEAILRRQRLKHILWISLDLLILPFTLLLVPLPGPNLVLYYPLLRALSHYRAIRGTAMALKSGHIEFKSLPDVQALEDNLQGLRTFLGRVS